MQIVDEKGLPKEKVIEVVEAALAAAYKKDYGKKGQVIKSKFDEVTKSADFFLVKEVVDETMRDFTVEEEPEEGAIGLGDVLPAVQEPQINLEGYREAGSSLAGDDGGSRAWSED